MRVRLVMAVVAMSMLFALPVDAQTDIDRTRDAVVRATERVEELLADLEATQRRGDDFSLTYWNVESRVQLLDIQIAESEQESALLAAQQDELRDDVRVIAVDQYVTRNADLGGVGDFATVADRAAAETLARLVVGVNNEAIDDLTVLDEQQACLLYTSPSPRDATLPRMPSSA